VIAGEPLGTRAKIAAEAIAFYTGTHLVGAALAENASASAIVQAVIAEWAAGRIGIHWTAPSPTRAAAAIPARVGLGAAVGFGGALLAVVIALLTKGATFHGARVSLLTLFISLISAMCFAVKTELLVHGVVVRLMRGVRNPIPTLLAGGLASTAAIFFGSGATSFDWAIAFAWGVVCTSMWVVFEGAWEAWGAHTSFLFASTCIFGGGMFDIRAQATSWGGGERGLFGGGAALVAVSLLAALAFLLAKKRTSELR